MSTKPEQWDEAKRRCHLTDDDIRMAKELGMQPRSLIKNIPSPSQQWKASVKEWVRGLYAKKFCVAPAATSRAAARGSIAPLIEFCDPAWPWPDRPEIPDLIIDMNEDFDDPWGLPKHPTEADIAETTSRLIRTQYLYRWGAQSVARALSSLPEVRKVAAFGAVAQPLLMEVPRFAKFRRFRVAVPHECSDIDLAVWVDDLSRLRGFKNAMALGLEPLKNSPYGGIAHHQVDVHLFDAGTSLYRGRLCIFGQCPKAGKRECFVPGCGEESFLQQFTNYRFDHARFEREPKVMLLDRASGFLVNKPRVVDVNPAKIIEWMPRDDEDEEDVPF